MLVSYDKQLAVASTAAALLAFVVGRAEVAEKFDNCTDATREKPVVIGCGNVTSDERVAMAASGMFRPARKTCTPGAGIISPRPERQCATRNVH